ncbi:hypothetical protein R1sor_007206 [Riccia sorocarpa]|uniref:Uncharacterized protein n=1 Tax=Riccia sorocarpa TaxID=122646 RepID=A0ABD3HPR9_9MARC
MAGIFKVGDRVYLRKPHSNNAVGHGTVVSVYPTFRVHTIPLGNDSIAVRVDHVDDYLHPLPLQSMEATHLGETELGMNIDYTNRQNWFLLEVYIVMKMTDGAKIPVAEGLVTQTAPSTFVNNKELEELNVGVAVTKLTDGISLDSLRNTSLSDFSTGPKLISWSIKSVFSKKFCRSLHSLQHEVHDDQESEVPVSSDDDDDDEEFIGGTPPPPESRESQREFEPAKKKRHYNSSVRNPPDPLRRARSNAKKKAQQETTEEKIRGIQRTTCCGDLCCRKVSYEVIRQCRLEYFGLPHDDKEEYIHTRLHMRHQSAIDEGKHIIDQKLICKRGFWTIYGFSKTKYYKMIAQSLDGIVRGYHGNKGRLKPRATTSEAHALLKQLLQQLAEPMPHMQCTFADGSTGVVQMLPSCYTRKSIMRELNAKIASIGGSGVSKSLFYTTWASTYKNYKFHKRGAFAKCDTCIKLKLQLMEERKPDFR